MLVLSRKRDDSVIIESPPGGIPEGTRIRVTVTDIRGDKVRLGFEAPKEVPVHREEVFDAIQRERTHDQKERIRPC